MRLKLPVYYSVRGTLPGRVRPMTYLFREWTTVDVPSVSPEEAPVAVIWKPAPEVRDAGARSAWSNQGISDPDGKQLTRWYEGRHWKALLVGDLGILPVRERRFLPHLGAESFARAVSKSGAGYSAIRLSCDTERNAREVSGNGNPLSSFQNVVWSMRDSAFNDLEHRLKKLMLVDGVLHMACLEPSIVIQYTERQDMKVYDLAVETDHDTFMSKPNSAPAQLPLGEFDLAVKIASVPAKEPDERTQAWFDYLRPEILLPEAFTTNWAKLRDANGLVMMSLSGLPVPELRRNRLVGDFLESCDDGERYELVRKMLEVFKNANVSGGTLAYLENALDILSDHEIGVEFGVPPGLPK